MTPFDPPHEPDWGDDPEFEDAFADDASEAPEPWTDQPLDHEFGPIADVDLGDLPGVDDDRDDADGASPTAGTPGTPESPPDGLADPDTDTPDPPTIELSLDADDDGPDDPFDAPDADSGVDADDLDAAEWPEPAAGLLSHDTLVSFAAIGGVEISAADLDHHLADLGITIDDHGLAPRDAVRVLDELGIDALVEHGSIDDLGDLLGLGSPVLVGGSDPAGGELSLTLVAVDPIDEVVSLTDGNGVRFELSFDDFEEGWEASTNEILRSQGGPSAISIQLGTDLFPVDLGLG